MIAAGIDIGTNTILMVVADVDRTGTLTVLEDLHAIPRLGEGLLEHGAITKESVERATDVLLTYRRVLNNHGNPPLLAVATAAMRNASNSDKVRKHLESALGAPIHVISGEQEASLTFIGTTAGLVGRTSVIDIGGGSTELVSGSGGRAEWARTVPLGSVSLTDQFCLTRPVPIETQGLLRSHIQNVLAIGLNNTPQQTGRLLAVAGTATSLAVLDSGIPTFESSAINGYRLRIESVYSWADRLLGLSLTQLLNLPGIDPKRADVLPAGVTILAEAMKFRSISEVEISVRGLRYGALFAAVGIA